jgi:lipopolysaccharide transport system ATP-binding protein
MPTSKKEKPIIEVKHLSKQYSIGVDGTYKRFSESFTSALRHPLKTLKDSRRQNDTFWALKDVNFEVERGEVLGIIGRNGAGKSTLLKILSRITYPTEGKVMMRGRVGSLLEVGTGFHPELSGRENIYFNGSILGMKKREIDKKFDEIVKFSGVEKFLDTPVKRYSSGMQVRLAFSVAANLDPEILVVDEVLAVGDAAFQKKCLGKMGEVAESGRTVLFVSHNMTAIRKLCSRAIMLQQGKIIADDTATEVVSKYIGEMQKSVLMKEWLDEATAPKNGSAILKKVATCDGNGTQLDEIYTNTPFNIEIEYNVKIEDALVGITVIFYDSENNCVFSSINNQEINWYGKPMPAGMYKSICKIPANFFNNGWFNLSIILFGKVFSDAKIIPEIIKMEILDGETVRGDFYGDYAGVVRPMLDWKTMSLKI